MLQLYFYPMACSLSSRIALMEAGIIELHVPDTALFRDQMTVVVAELEAEAQIR